MKNLVATTAMALMFGTSAIAEGHMAAFEETSFDTALNLYASDLLGARVYATESEVDASAAVTADATTEWDDIGEINEILLTRDGQVQSVIVGVGGFLGLGEKDVAVNMSQIKFVSDGESPDDYFLVINSNQAAITDAPTYERVVMDEEEAETDETADTADKQMDLLIAPDVERDGYKSAMFADLNTEDLTGARVYGINDEDVGEISELLLTDDGKLDRAVIDVGGFLGLGERPVALSLDELTIMRSDETGDFRVYVDTTEDKLEAKAAYEG
ncbi:PRC-barrel domain-containing protein [bacterium]|nr:PRC-barrel domain-containing protein [bacterium]